MWWTTTSPYPAAAQYNDEHLALLTRIIRVQKTNKELLFLGVCTGYHRELSGFHRLPCNNSGASSFVLLGDGRISQATASREGFRRADSSLSCRFSGFPMEMGMTTSPKMKIGLLVEWKGVPDDCPSAWQGAGNAGINGNGRNEIALIGFSYAKTTSNTTEENIEALILLHGSLAPKRYKYSEVTKITSSLNNKLGEGGYGMVFKGRLDDGRLVAVKFLHDSKGDGEEFVNENFHPKIADFGLAKLCHTKESKLSMTGARGTPGFIAPEVHSRTLGVVSAKSDVYSYGMMLLEMVGGRKNVKSIAQESSEKYFPHWIYDHFGQDDGLQACEVTRENKGIARKMSVIGTWCIQILPRNRLP
ncbi:unnamed protein product [Miscanthus lutarioriparius]|uniref:Protein kinase domain-containing protein n=1 Tax=Miscanthus lutarioriparius TaxID=422564 RepID=A0A811PGF1_9POAL|nr:unnamed protein product [Miscanthus lutarioriparius]